MTMSKSAKTFYLSPSLDVLDLEAVERVVRATCTYSIVSSYKVGFSLGLSFGLPAVVACIRKHTAKPIIYDHQKAGTDIPDTGKLFARTLKGAGIDQAILFPQAGPMTLRAWVSALQDEGIRPIVGALMTHEGFLLREGGYLDDALPHRAYVESARLGVRHFVVPLTKPEVMASLRDVFPSDAEFYSPGYGAQGGNPHAFPTLAVHHLFVGRALLQAPDPAAYVEEATRSLAATP